MPRYSERRRGKDVLYSCKSPVVVVSAVHNEAEVSFRDSCGFVCFGYEYSSVIFILRAGVSPRVAARRPEKC